MWLSQSKELRVSKPFYSESIFAEENRNKVQDELEKINRFNVLLENSQLKDLVQVSGNDSCHELSNTSCGLKDLSASSSGSCRKKDFETTNKENFYMELSGGSKRVQSSVKDVTADDVLVTLSKNTRTLNDIDEFLRNIALNK